MEMVCSRKCNMRYNRHF